ncbi:MAG: DUF192 domain-containing protein [Verrucomicrobia bacterium]|nr:DUF192 domain-containing protein [Verrucomicrobiota bacterium]
MKKTFPLTLALALIAATCLAGGETTLKIGEEKLLVEVAVTPGEQAQGLMNRDFLPAERGMLFVFPHPKKAFFWMRNTSLPLDLAFLDSEGVILEIHPLVPFEETRVESKSEKVAYAIETNRDWFASRGLKPGLKVQGLPR